jgi:hypothetical protein
MKKIKVINKQLDSAKEYVDALSDKYSKLNVVRVDLAYKKPHSDNITLEDATKDLDRLFNNRRSKPTIFKDQVGYICKKEYTKERGVHIHAVFFYDGQKVKDDTKKAIDIGAYWKKEITDNKGSYYNCNLNAKKKYGKDNGIGMIGHSDSAKRENLDTAISYLCKDKQNIEPIKKNKRDRAFTRGTIPKSKGNIGRPRK